MTTGTGREIVTSRQGTGNGTDDGTAYTFMSGNGGLLVPLVTVPPGTDGTSEAGTGTGTAGQNGSAVPSVPTRTLFDPIIRRTRNRGTGEPGNHGSVPVVTESTAAAPTSAAPRHAAKTKSHGHQARAWLTVVVAVVASLGQAQYARAHQFVSMIKIPEFPGLWGYTIGPVDVTPWLAVAVFDLAVAALLYSGRAAIKMGLSPWPFWYAAMAVAGFSVYTNTQHAGGWVTAPASAVLFLIWFLTLYYEYLEDRKDKGNLADAVPNLLLSKLVIIDRRLALRAWVIASTRPLARGVAHRKTMGETVSPRDLAIQVARLYLDVYDDQVITQLRTGREERKDRVRVWQRRQRRAAFSRAVMTASDAVDHYLGLPVIERTGIKAARISYADAIEESPRVHQLARVYPPAPTQPTPRQLAAQQPASQPASTVQLVPVAPPVPDVPEEQFDLHADRIAAVQAKAGDAWWAGPKPLIVDQVQKYGVGNRRHAAQVAKCLVVLRARRLADEQAATQDPVPQQNAPHGGAA